MPKAPRSSRRRSRSAPQGGAPRVTVVGAGLAGMTAALRLLERGFHVTLVEQHHFLGGKLGAFEHPKGSGDYHEHSFHMYLSWYHNFWRIADAIGIIDRFVPQPALTYLKRREFPKPGEASRLSDVGAAGTAWRNLFSGVESPANMYLYGYSLIDLLASAGPSGHLERASVSSFLESRPYFTPEVEVLHRHTLAKAFASPTHLNSAQSYQQFIGYGFRQPSPMTWLLKGNTNTHLFEPFEKHLRRVARDRGVEFRLETGVRIDAVDLDEAGRIAGLTGTRLKDQAFDFINRPPPRGDYVRDTAAESVILAVPFEALCRFLDGPMTHAAPELASVHKLRGKPMASIDIYFREKLGNIPAGITLLADSPFDLTFVDNSQLWDNGDGGPANRTFLNLIISDFSAFTSHTTEEEVAAILESALRELRNYIEFDYSPVGASRLFARRRRGRGGGRRQGQPRTDSPGRDAVDRARCHVQMNVHEQLFVNEVGTWDFRPEATTRIANLFIAGDYCKTFVDVVTIEGAVVSGLLAAEAVQERAGAGKPVEILRPDTVPLPLLRTLKWMGAPYAYAANAWSMMQSGLQSGFRSMFPNG